MCGIVGYLGKRQAGPIILEGLRRLEYRGYDSAGIATLTSDHHFHVAKAVGRIDALANRALDEASRRFDVSCGSVMPKELGDLGIINMEIC